MSGNAAAALVTRESRQEGRNSKIAPPSSQSEALLAPPASHLPPPAVEAPGTAGSRPGWRVCVSGFERQGWAARWGRAQQTRSWDGKPHATTSRGNRPGKQAMQALPGPGRPEIAGCPRPTLAKWSSSFKASLSLYDLADGLSFYFKETN